MMLAETRLCTADYIILVGYFALMLAIGAYFWRYMKGMREYFSGSNQIPWWLSGISFYMTSFSAFLFVTYSENAFRYGFVAVTLGWMVVPAVLIGAIFFSSRWRRARITSPPEYLEERYGLGFRQTVAWARIVVQLIDDGLKIFATSMFVGKAVGLNINDSILYTGLITLAYTFMGGLWAVAVTDFVQFVVMLAGAVVLVPLALAKVGGPVGLVQGSPPGFLSLSGGRYTWGYLLGWFLLVLWNYNTSFGLVQRYYCVRDEREARKTGYFVALLCLIGTPIYFIPALAAKQFMPNAEPASIYASLCVNLLPAGLLGLIIAAMFSATMSTLSGDYNVIAAVLTEDVYRRLLAPQASQKRLVFVGRLATLVVGLVPIGIAYYVSAVLGNDILFTKMVKLFSVAAPPIAIPMLAGILWRRANYAGAAAAFGSGVAVGLVMFFRGLPENQIAIATTLTTIAILAIVSVLTSPGPAEQKRRESFLKKLDTPIPAAESAVAAGGPSPFRVVGGTTIAVGLLLAAITPLVPWGLGALTNLLIAGGLVLLGAIWVAASRPRKPLEEIES